MASKSKRYYDSHPAAKKKKTEYDKKYNARPGEKKRRAARNKSRRKLEREGAVRKGQDVHHKDGNPRNTKRSNLKAESKSKNRGRK